ncbi:MAG TPA: hypothetical protein VL201_02140 [Patescibacteria group bacterium]|jgi:hypothetical protein|nr:hypothetical protein [Patescibacteria group bacterium]
MRFLYVFGKKNVFDNRKIFICIFLFSFNLCNTICFSGTDDFHNNDYFVPDVQSTCDYVMVSKQPPVAPSLILDLLNQIEAKSIIEEPFFLRTNSLNNRIVQDLPLFNDPRAVKRRDVVPSTVFSASPFYTQISHAKFSGKDDKLKNYLALDDKTVIAALRDVFSSLKQFSDQFYFDTIKVFNALKNTSVEQRRAGILFRGEGRLGECSIMASIPLYYLERNFQLSEKDKTALEEEFGVTSKKEQDRFKKKHLIADKIGVGDMRLKVSLPLTESWKEHFEISFFTTLPVGGAFAKGLLGSSFVGFSSIPALNIDNLVSKILAGEQAEVFTEINELGLNALDRLSAALLEQNLTHARHFSLGLGLTNKLKLKDFIKIQSLKRWHWNYNLSCEYYVPSKHHRSFINKIDRQKIDDLNLTDPQDPEKTLQIFTQEALDRFFLRSFRAKIHPGVSVRSYSTFIYKRKEWHVWLGSDLWFKSPEKVVFLDASSAVQVDLDRHKVKNSYGLALGTALGFSYTYDADSYVFDAGVDAYATYCTRGIGQEVGFALKFTAHFQ